MTLPYELLADGWVIITRKSDGQRIKVSPDESFRCPCCGRWTVTHACQIVAEETWQTR